MDTAKELFAYLVMHGPTLAGIIFAILAVAESIVRLTKTKKDDTAVERIGKVIRKVMDYASAIIPNRKVGGGEHPKQADKEVKK